MRISEALEQNYAENLKRAEAEANRELERQRQLEAQQVADAEREHQRLVIEQQIGRVATICTRLGMLFKLEDLDEEIGQVDRTVYTKWFTAKDALDVEGLDPRLQLRLGTAQEMEDNEFEYGKAINGEFHEMWVDSRLSGLVAGASGEEQVVSTKAAAFVGFAGYFEAHSAGAILLKKAFSDAGHDSEDPYVEVIPGTPDWQTVDEVITILEAELTLPQHVQSLIRGRVKAEM